MAQPPSTGLRSSPAPPASPTGPIGEETEDIEDARDRIGYGRFGRWTPLALAVLLIAALLAIGIAGQQESTRDVTGGAPPAGVGGSVGAAAPDFALALLDGRTLRLRDLRGKTVVLNFWASWCEPCAEEMPALQRVAATAGDDVVLVGVGLKNDDDEEARAFAARFGVTYPVGRDLGGPATDPRGPIEAAYGVIGAPTTIVIAPDGTVATIALGPQTEDQLRQLVGRR